MLMRGGMPDNASAVLLLVQFFVCKTSFLAMARPRSMSRKYHERQKLLAKRSTGLTLDQNLPIALHNEVKLPDQGTVSGPDPFWCL